MCKALYGGTSSTTQSARLRQREAVRQRCIQRLLLTIGDQKSLLISRSPLGQWTDWGHEPILAQDHQDPVQGGKGYMAGGITKRLMGVQDDGKDTYRRNTFSTSIWKRRGHSSWSRAHQLPSRKPWRGKKRQSTTPAAWFLWTRSKQQLSKG